MDEETSFPRPAVTADVVLIAGEPPDRSVLLIERGHAPFQGMWALPGGFVEQYEPPDRAAARELAEETGLVLPEPPSRIVGVYGQRGRDPRGWTVTVAYLVELGPGEPPQVRGGDDAARAAWWRLDGLPALAFDHDGIVADALEALGVRTPGG